MRKKLVSILYFLITFFCIFLEASCLPKNNTGQFTLSNRSSEIITYATIEVCNQVIELDNINPHEEFNGTFKIRGDSHYKVIVSFASGKEIRDELGYVTHGFDFKHTITVTDSKIFISDTKVE